ncbi:MAG: Rrf2 family protein [Planctomycetota bacterium]|jgi:Rrf2 family protein
MLKLTKRTEYGLIALVDLARRPGQVVSMREIGERHPVPKRLTGEALKALAHAGVVESARGAGGGFWLTRSPEEISLGEVVAALEGAPVLTSCEDLGASHKDGSCEVEGNCPIRSPLQNIRQGIWTLMQDTSLRSLMGAAPLLPDPVPTDLTA